MIRRNLAVGASLMVVAATVASCGSGREAFAPFALQVSPNFVQGAIPGAATGVLVTITDETDTDTPVTLTVSADGAQVTVEPGEISQGEVAEVTVIPDAATGERPLEISITGRRGQLEQAATRSTTVLPWEDDRSDYARELLHLFTTWLADQQPDLGIGPGTEFSGSFVAPELLVVSHYLFMSDDWELGLSWHIMVPPHDWAEIYLRSRNEAAPNLAFRLESQQAALQDGIVTIASVEPPAEVVR